MIVTAYETREEWLDARTSFVGASEASAICGQGYARTNEQTVWLDKVSPAVGREDNATLSMRLGSNCEPGVIKTAVEYYHLPIRHSQYGVVRSKQYPFIACTPDGFDEKDRPVEVKNLTYHGSSLLRQGQIPLLYQIQMQHQMYCTEADAALLLANLANDDLLFQWVPRNEDFIQSLVAKLVAFWDKVVQKIQPEWKDPEEHREFLKRFFPKSENVYRELPLLADELLDKRDAAALKMKEYEVDKIAAENALKEMLGEAAYGVLPSGRVLKWENQSKASYVVKASTSRVFREVTKLPAGVELEQS